MSIRFPWKETVVGVLFFSPIIMYILHLTVFDSYYQASARKESQVAKASNPLSSLFESYFALRKALAGDEAEDPSIYVNSMSIPVKTLLATESTRAGQGLFGREQVLRSIQYCLERFDSQSLQEARESFKALSQALFAYALKFGSPVKSYVFYCPMANLNWLQEGKAIGNPFYGSEMIECGNLTCVVSGGSI